MDDNALQRLIKATTRSAWRHAELNTKLRAMLVERYGVDYSEIDADSLIDSFDTLGSVITLAECDNEMTLRGFPPRKE